MRAVPQGSIEARRVFLSSLPPPPPRPPQVSPIEEHVKRKEGKANFHSPRIDISSLTAFILATPTFM